MATWTTTATDIIWTAVDDPSVTWVVQLNPVSGGGGSSVHNDLSGRSVAGAHPASAITGLSTVATTGAYSDLSGTPTLGTAAAADTTAFEAAGAVSTHASVTTSVHGIADTSALETTTGAQSKVDTHVNDTTAAHAASAISVDASGFNGNLTTSDDTVQEVAQKLDDLSIPNVSGKANIVNTDGDPGITIYVGSIDPDVSYTPAVGDVWIEVP